MSPISHISPHLTSFNLFLVDAVGVLYNERGPIPGAAEAVRRMQAKAPVVVVTNNTDCDTAEISRRLFARGIPVEADKIYSSGFALALKDRRVFVFGLQTSHIYAKNAGAQVVETLEDADAVLMTSVPSEGMPDKLQALIRYLTDHPLPLICSNPDLFIMGTTGIVPVIGSYAKEVSEKSGVPVEWIGKPYASNAVALQGWLKKRLGIEAGKKTLFVDDNLTNVLAMRGHLGVKGACVTETGLSAGIDWARVSEKPDFTMPTLGWL